MKKNSSPFAASARYLARSLFFLAALGFVPSASTALGFVMDPPFLLPGDVVMERNIVYTTVGSRDLHVDLFLPKTNQGPRPAIVYFNGWGAKDVTAKEAFYRQAAYMAEKGFVGACVEYRIAFESQYPAAVYDAKAAVRWVRANAAKYDIDPDRIGAAGGSGGGFAVGILGTTGDVPAYEGDEGNAGVSSRVAAVAAFNPLLDWIGSAQSEEAKLSDKSFMQSELNWARKLGYSGDKLDQDWIVLYLGCAYAQNPERWKAASPLYQAGAKTVPFLLLCGDADELYPQTTRMLEELRAAGVRAELFTAPGARHGFFNLPPWFDPTLKRMDGFFESTLLHPK